jgi:hypothetical protein
LFRYSEVVSEENETRYLHVSTPDLDGLLAALKGCEGWEEVKTEPLEEGLKVELVVIDAPDKKTIAIHQDFHPKGQKDGLTN